ncbi:hypothetical protein TNCV_1447541 [Trichonephila clavipes]|nr:hypothetical protein TNCV_1447541 [Trichonephila clavipes]
MFDPSSFVNPTPLAHADTSRDVLPGGGTSQFLHDEKSCRKVAEDVKIKLGVDGHYIGEDDIDQAIRNNPNPTVQELTESFNVHRTRDGWLTWV